MLNRQTVSNETHEVRGEAIDNAIAECRRHELEIVLPPELVMDVLMTPAFSNVRPDFRQWCLCCIRELPGVSDIDRDRLCQMVAAGL